MTEAAGNIINNKREGVAPFIETVGNIKKTVVDSGFVKSFVNILISLFNLDQT